MNLMHRCTALILAGVCLAVASMPARAQPYPVKSVRWVLGFPGGGASDVLARSVAEKLNKAWGQQVIIDNRPGASGIIADDLVSKSAPDGYTILLASSTYANLISMGKKLPFDPLQDLVPVMLLASVPNVLSVHPSLPVKSVKNFVALAKARPGQINYGTGGALTGPHLATELFRLMTGIDILHIPYKGTPPAVTDLVAGRIQVMFALTPVVLPHIQSGKLRGIAVSGSKRIPELSELPTVGESIPGYEATVWYGFLVPKETPPAIIGKLNRDFSAAIAMPDVVARLASVGFQVTATNPEHFSRFMTSEVSKWRQVIRDAHIPVD